MTDQQVLNLLASYVCDQAGHATCGLNAHLPLSCAAVCRAIMVDCHSGVGYVKTPRRYCLYLSGHTRRVRPFPASSTLASAHAAGSMPARRGRSAVQVGAAGLHRCWSLVGPAGTVNAYEIEQDLAARARVNLKGLSQVKVRPRTGITDDLPKVDAVYVNAGTTQPSWAWLDALRPNGRLIFTVACSRTYRWDAPDQTTCTVRLARQVLSAAAFMSCTGPQDDDAGRRWNAAFASGGADAVRSFRTDDDIDQTCWFRGDGWWLSTADAEHPSGEA
jgi:protein-L-isoaspartate(D-aspartate) O-methyltransferase